MSRDDDVLEVREILFVRKLAYDFVDEVECGEVRIGRRHATRPPAVTSLGPHHLVRRRLVLASRKVWRDDDRVVECAGKKSRRCSGLEVVIRIAIRAVDHDERACHRRIRPVQRVCRIDHRPRGTAPKYYPSLASRSGVRAWSSGLCLARYRNKHESSDRNKEGGFSHEKRFRGKDDREVIIPRAFLVRSRIRPDVATRRSCPRTASPRGLLRAYQSDAYSAHDLKA